MGFLVLVVDGQRCQCGSAGDYCRISPGLALVECRPWSHEMEASCSIFIKRVVIPSDCPASGKRRGTSARRPCWQNSCWPVGETHPVVPTRPVGAIERLPVHRYLAEPHTHAQRRIDRSSRQGRIPQGSRGTLPFFERPPNAGGRKQWLHLHQGREPLDLDGLLATSSTKVAHRVSPIKRLHHRTHGIRF